MRTGLLFLPFLALLVGALGTAVGSAMTEVSWITPASWAVAAGIVALWVSLDFEGFVRFFVRKGARYGASSGLTVLLAILVIIGAGMLSIRPRFDFSYDATSQGVNTLSDQSVKIVENLKDENHTISIEAYIQDPMKRQSFSDMMTLYKRVGDIFTIEYTDAQVDFTKAKSRNITTDTAVFILGERESRITDFSEEKVSNALINLLKVDSKSILFITGHGEYSLDSKTEAGNMGLLVDELSILKYESKAIALDEYTEIPEAADAVVIAGPKYDFKDNEVKIIDEYLKKGGSLLVMADAVVNLPTLNGLLEQYGLGFNNDIIILSEDDPRANLLPRNISVWAEFDEFNAVSRGFAARDVRLLIPNTRTVKVFPENKYQLKADIVGETTDMMERIDGVASEADLRTINPDRLSAGKFPVLAVAAGKVSTPKLAGNGGDESGESKKDVDTDKLGETGDKEIRIVIAGSSQFANNAGAERAENKDLFINISNYLMQDDSLISIRPKDPKRGTIDVSSPGSQIGLAFLLFVYPFIFLGSGLLYWLIRRRA